MKPHRVRSNSIRYTGIAVLLLGLQACGTDQPQYGPLDHLFGKPSGRFVQVSSFDTTGGNADRQQQKQAAPRAPSIRMACFGYASRHCHGSSKVRLVGTHWQSKSPGNVKPAGRSWIQQNIVMPAVTLPSVATEEPPGLIVLVLLLFLVLETTGDRSRRRTRPRTRRILRGSWSQRAISWSWSLSMNRAP